MTAEIPPIVPAPSDERRAGERRKGWHTPDDCPKVTEFKDAVDSIFAHLKEGNARMEAMEAAIFENNRIATENLQRLEKKQDVNQAVTDGIAEILEMGRGVFKFFFFTGKWLRRIVMFLGPPITVIVTLFTACIGLWYALKPPK
jgi:hypothetical protein